ncbi:hypothetical protein [Clostridium algoriphilum]|nr:hypothetical protein [Clostridium algoriphilum]
MKKSKKALVLITAIFVVAGIVENVKTKPRTFTLKPPVDHN